MSGLGSAGTQSVNPGRQVLHWVWTLQVEPVLQHVGIPWGPARWCCLSRTGPRCSPAGSARPQSRPPPAAPAAPACWGSQLRQPQASGWGVEACGFRAWQARLVCQAGPLKQLQLQLHVGRHGSGAHTPSPSTLSWTDPGWAQTPAPALSGTIRQPVRAMQPLEGTVCRET